MGVVNNLDDSDLPTVLRTVGLTGNSEGAVSIFAELALRYAEVRRFSAEYRKPLEIVRFPGVDGWSLARAAHQGEEVFSKALPHLSTAFEV